MVEDVRVMPLTWRILICFHCVIITLFVVPTHAKDNKSLGAAGTTVHWFCAIDAAGARMSGKTMKFIRPLLGYEYDIGPDTTTVIKSYAIVREKIGAGKATVDVEYQIVGGYGVEFVEEEKTETFEFGLELADGVWKIVKYPMIGRVFESVLEAHLKELGRPPLREASFNKAPTGRPYKKGPPEREPPGTPTP